MISLDDFLQKFPPTGRLRKAVQTDLEQFEETLPEEWLAFLRIYGCGNYGNGVLKVIDPALYTPNLSLWLGGVNPARVPILMTGFGNLLYYRKLTETDNDVCLLDIHHRRTATCAYSFEAFMRLITEDRIIESLLEKSLFEQAAARYGKLAENEIFCFVPALALGGAESIEQIQKCDGGVHQRLLFGLQA